MKRIVEAIKKMLGTRKRRILAIVIASVVVVLAIGGVEAYRILYTPQDLFNFSTMQPSAPATEEVTPEAMDEPEGTETAASLDTTAVTPSATPSPTPSPTPTPAPTPTPNITTGKDILNVLLIGVDRSQSVGKGSGEDPHADVMMVVAINFKKKRADLISLPRDTFIHAPEVMDGVYKLNASINLGGGYAAKGGRGFLKVCEAAEYMLGGVPVDYYYAVDFTSLTRVVNMIGGVDYVVEDRAYSRKHIKGKQHMDGLDVLFYVRSRKVGPEQGDDNRVDRQKKMMIAIFQKLTKSGKLSMLPELVKTAKGGVRTNTTVEQTLALANFGKSIKPDKIGMYSMTGHRYSKGGWRYVFTDQKDRQAIIKKVYGINVREQVHCSPQYADWLLDYGLDAIRSLKTAKQLLDYADARKAKFTAEQRKAYNALTAAYKSAQKAYDSASISLYGTSNRGLASERKKLRTCSEALARLVGYKTKLVWTYSRPFWRDPAINAVEVDFR